MFGTNQLGVLMLGGSEEEDTGGQVPITNAVEIAGNGFTINVGGALVQVMGYTPPQGSANVEDTMCFGETTVTRKTGVPEWSDAELDLKYSPSDHATLLSYFKSQELIEDITATFSDGTTEVYDGYLSKFGVQGFDPKTPAMKAKASITVQADVVYTPFEEA